MDIRFDNKRALVTGAGKGIGRGIAIQLAALGAKVHAISRTQADLDSLKQEAPDIEVYNVDIANWERTRATVESIGPIDLLVNNAAVGSWTPFFEVTKEELDNLFDINYKAIFNITQVVAKCMVEWGHGGAIVNISSIGALRVTAEHHTIYCSSKAAVDMLTKTMAMELGPHKIRVNSVNPGLVMTAMTLQKFGSTDKQEYVRSRTPLQRVAEVGDIVDATLFLLSDKASMINGIIMPVDGGFINRV